MRVQVVFDAGAGNTPSNPVVPDVYSVNGITVFEPCYPEVADCEIHPLGRMVLITRLQGAMAEIWVTFRVAR